MTESLGPYRLESRIGHGAMGEVWRALGPEGAVAIKLIPEFLLYDKALIERLEREAKAMAKLDHPNVVKTYGFGDHDGRAYLVLEYLEGETLADRLTGVDGSDRPSHLEIEELERIGCAIADALAYIHARGVIHRDLKPQNIFLTSEGRVKLIDLGVAKVLDEASLTVTGSHFGTPAYMAPEAFIDSKNATSATDIWSLGVILYECATGRLPFAGRTAATIIAKIADRRVVPQSSALARPDLPQALSSVIERCLARDPTSRPTAADLVESWTGQRPRYDRSGWIMPSSMPAILIVMIPVIVGIGIAMVIPGFQGASRTSKVPLEKAPALPKVPEPRDALPPAETGPSGIIHRVPSGFSVSDPLGVLGEADFEGPRGIRNDATGYEFVLIPSGTFTMGQDEGSRDERPAHKVHARPFWIATTEVTMGLFDSFVRETGYRTAAERGGGGVFGGPNTWRRDSKVTWRSPLSPDESDLFDSRRSWPVLQVDRDDASAFCSWIGARLPTESEWEKASRGTDERLYPWGDADDPSRRNGRGQADGNEWPSAVGAYPAGASPYGALDMSGNAAEWVDGRYEPYPGGSWRPDTGRPERGVVRGGAWNHAPTGLTTTNRPAALAEPIATDIGFRCAVGL